MKPFYNPRNRNPRYDNAPLSWSQSYYDRERRREQPVPCGFVEREK